MKSVVVASVMAMLLAGANAAGADSYSEQFIFPPQEKHVHASSIVETPEGDLLAAWFHGSGERTADDVLVQGARLRKSESAWSDVFLMADVPDFPDCNPVLFIDQEERLWLFWVVVMANRWENSLPKYRWSTDYADDGPPKWDWQDVIHLRPDDDFPEQMAALFRELSPSEPMWAEYAHPYSRMLIAASHDKLKRQLGWMTRNQPLVLESGRILLPMYSDGFNISLMAYSDDGGERWHTSAPIVGLGPIQPTIAQRQDGTLVAFFRDSGLEPKRMQRAESDDDGETWSLTRDTDLPNPSASMEVKVLDDGRWILIYNDTERGRHSLAVALSEDEGDTWPVMRHLEHWEEGEGRFSYPSIIQARDGRIHATYSHSTEDGAAIKHVSFMPDWIAAE